MYVAGDEPSCFSATVTAIDDVISYNPGHGFSYLVLCFCENIRHYAIGSVNERASPLRALSCGGSALGRQQDAITLMTINDEGGLGMHNLRRIIQLSAFSYHLK